MQICVVVSKCKVRQATDSIKWGQELSEFQANAINVFAQSLQLHQALTATFVTKSNSTHNNI
jgi:hypothetical protein